MAPAAVIVISLLVFSAVQVHLCVSSIRFPVVLRLHLSCAVHLPKCFYYNANFIEGDDSIERNELQYSMLSTTDPKAFDGVQELNISGNVPLPSFDFFRHLPMLATLNMSRMNLSFTPAASNIFTDLTQLSELDLSANRITNVPDGVFTKLLNLDWLDLSGNKVQLTNTTFTGLERLRALNLATNDISMLPMGCFAGLLSLNNLNLRHNHISKLDFGTFSIHGLKRFGVLDLSYNRFVDPNLSPLATLGSLNTLLLHGIDLWTIDPQVLRLFKLQHLGIQHTEVKCRNLIDLGAADIELIADDGDYVYDQRNMYGIRCEL
ncbi:insulin-like growth factor-binding protein complex acid labile subunit [Anopheles aquasalis]|uniref:insulin-like growth factor-binding protein complex acid labile subunit n=1 Tax=Anopheles aquasalis TaxID=42839 RepID=UPI00215B237F|nr:insulin-like growth factor-binding protein complex acid labile subunit [Anopheles aquasalis]